MTINPIASLLDRFFMRFFDDSVYVYDKKTIDNLIFQSSQGMINISDPGILNLLKTWESEGRIKIGDSDAEFIVLNQKYWAERTGRI